MIFEAIKKSAILLGQVAGGLDVHSVLLGIRTLKVRMIKHEEQTKIFISWLRERPEVEKIFHPAEHNHPGHQFWKRDFAGSSSVFSILLSRKRNEIEKSLDSLKTFSLGFSYGGFESLILPTFREENETLVRLHIGFEDLEDLKQDWAHAFDK